MLPILLLGAVLYGPQLIERIRKPGALGAAPADPFADLFLGHVRAAGTALGQAQRGGGLVAVGVARGHIEGARQVFPRLPASRKSEAASIVQRAQELVQRVQAELARPVEVPAVAPMAEAPETSDVRNPANASGVLQFQQR